MTFGSFRPPALLVLTDRRQCERAGHVLHQVVAAVCNAPVPVAVLFREKDLPPTERLRLGEEVRAAVDAAGVPLLVASDPALATELGAAAVHLAAADPVPVTATIVHGRSCHDADEVRVAVREGAAYATVSPVFLTESKPGYGPAIGATALAALVEAAGDMPVYALGGVTPDRVSPCMAAGVAGVAVMGAVMAAPDPGAVLSDFGAQLLGARR